MKKDNNSPAHNKFFARYATPKRTKEMLMYAIEKRFFDQSPTEGSRLFLTTPAELACHLDPKYLERQASEEYKKEADQFKAAYFPQELEKALKDPENKYKTEQEIRSQLENIFKDFSTYKMRDRRISESLSSLTRNITYLYGDKTIFDKYLNLRNKILEAAPERPNPMYTNRRQEIAFNKMLDEISKYLAKADKSSIVQGKLLDEIDLKRELYRFVEQMLTNLGFWHHTKYQNTIDIAKELGQRGIIKQSVADKLVELMNYCLGLRLRKQEKLRKQGYAIPVTMKEYESTRKKAATEVANLAATLNILMKTQAPQPQITNVEHKLLKAQVTLADIDKVKPGPHSILTDKIMEELNTKYLPFMKELFNALKAFVEGDSQAFEKLN